MASNIIATISLDNFDFRGDIEYLNKVAKSDDIYDEFGQGFRANPTLINSSGNENDTLFRESLEAFDTHHMTQLDSISKLINQVFERKYLRMVRARNLTEGIIMPHRDYLEVNDDVTYYRIFLPIEFNCSAFHSDESGVFQMKPGEIWFLDASVVHSASNFSSKSRWFLCFDFFLPEGIDKNSIFKKNPLLNWNTSIFYIQRPKLDEPELDNIVSSISTILTEWTIRDVALILSKLHFKYDIPVDYCYELLRKAADTCGSEKVVHKVQELIDYLIHHRSMHERFHFS